MNTISTNPFVGKFTGTAHDQFSKDTGSSLSTHLKLHTAVTILMAAAVFPLLRLSGLPMRFDWRAYFELSFGVGVRSLVLFILLAVLLYPLRAMQALGRHDASKNAAEQLRAAVRSGWNVAAPCAYLICGLILMFAYNDIVACFRFDGSYDAALNRMDSWLLHGATVSSLAHRAIAYFPTWALHFGEGIYFGLHPLVGAVILFLALSSQPKKAFEFVGTALTAYYVALAVFLFVPTTGPYYLCDSHAALVQTPLAIYSAEAAVVLRIGQLPHISKIGTDYLIGIPSLHIAQPLIAIWFLRQHRRLAVLIAIYTTILVPVILLFEVHYLVDLIAGAALAVAAVAICDPDFRAPRQHVRARLSDAQPKAQVMPV